MFIKNYLKDQFLSYIKYMNEVDLLNIYPKYSMEPFIQKPVNQKTIYPGYFQPADIRIVPEKKLSVSRVYCSMHDIT